MTPHGCYEHSTTNLKAPLPFVFFLGIQLIYAQPNGQAPPHFVIIFAPDLGYGDFGVYGNPTIKTPTSTGWPVKVHFITEGAYGQYGESREHQTPYYII